MNHVDYFNQPITEKSKLLVAISGRLRLCKVDRLNKKSLLVSQVAFIGGRSIRVNPVDTVVMSSEELTALTLKGKV